MRKLLDAGAEVFATKGYYAARVDDIVKLAATSHGTFYLYFANKEDLFRALAAGGRRPRCTTWPSARPARAGPGRLRGAARVGREFADALRALRAGDRRVDRGRDRQPASSAGSATTCIAQLHRRAHRPHPASGAPPELDPQIAAVALVAMFERLNYYAMTRQVRVERDAMIDTLAVRHARRDLRTPRRANAIRLSTAGLRAPARVRRGP